MTRSQLPVPSLPSRFVQPFLRFTLFAFDLGLYLFDSVHRLPGSGL